MNQSDFFYVLQEADFHANMQAMTPTLAGTTPTLSTCPR